MSRVLQNVTDLKVWGSTQYGYPKNGDYYLECGHKQMGSRPERMHLHIFMRNHQMSFRVKCKQCSGEVV